MYDLPTVPMPEKQLKLMYWLGIIPAHVKAQTHLVHKNNDYYQFLISTNFWLTKYHPPNTLELAHHCLDQQV